ncbi:MAG: hypothetical protein HY445_03675 [Candidatus Niyogibacteria bacterium]|nr:hypothetical protein [Candidatus Niyogibacteria bacterium]
MQKGIIQIIIILLLFVVILSLLGVSLTSIMNNQTLRDNFQFIWKWALVIWNNVLKTPVEYVWNIFLTFIFEPLKEQIEKANPAAAP